MARRLWTPHQVCVSSVVASLLWSQRLPYLDKRVELGGLYRDWIISFTLNGTIIYILRWRRLDTRYWLIIWNQGGYKCEFMLHLLEIGIAAATTWKFPFTCDNIHFKKMSFGVFLLLVMTCFSLAFYLNAALTLHHNLWIPVITAAWVVMLQELNSRGFNMKLTGTCKQTASSLTPKALSATSQFEPLLCLWTPPAVKSHFPAASRQTDERYSQIPHHPEHTQARKHTFRLDHTLFPAFTAKKAVVWHHSCYTLRQTACPTGLVWCFPHTHTHTLWHHLVPAMAMVYKLYVCSCVQHIFVRIRVGFLIREKVGEAACTWKRCSFCDSQEERTWKTCFCVQN